MNQTEKIESLQEALRILFLEQTKELEVSESNHQMARILETDGLEMKSEAYQLLMDRLTDSAFQRSLGQLLEEAIRIEQSDKAELATRLRIPVRIMDDLLGDEVYPNNVPVVLFKNLLLALNISFQSAQESIKKTFSILQNRLENSHGLVSISPAYRKKSQSERGISFMAHGDGKELFENQEALDKYLKRLGELMK